MSGDAYRTPETGQSSIRNLPEGPRYWVQTTLDGKILDASGDAATLLGFRRRGGIGRWLPQFIGPDSHDVIAEMRRAYTGRLPVSSQRVLRGGGRKGEWLPVQIQLAQEPGELVWILWA
jgi:hypothetical protein